jgi:hypothetical protein
MGVSVLRSLERTIAAASQQVVLLAPSVGAISNVFESVDIDPARHQSLIQEVQRLRGSIYLQDGAIREDQLTTDGRHETPEDDKSWHFLSLNPNGGVEACVWYLEHKPDVRFEDTRAALSPLAQDREWRQTLWRAVDAELTCARRNQLKYVELGGWAASEECRGLGGPLALVLALWGFGRRRGGGLGMTTATFRHCSATILKRLGGSRFEIDGMTLPAYFDRRYGCMMELLRFDSRRPNPRYLGLIDHVRDSLSNFQVIARPSAVDSLIAADHVVRVPLRSRFEALAS